ncbi:MAG: prepilin peptidase [Candidatus Omnitrophica bacterium]|nr:prepilin peptidase [Candidatus Omnitrophota bacterium]
MNVDIWIQIIIVVFGLIIGSFLNVCIYRLPKGKSIVFPGSSCTKCGYKIKWYENIPVLSYIFLLGKCSKCKSRISIVYPIVEILTAALFLTLYLHYGLVPKMFIYFILFSSLIIASFIDFDIQEIPDVITLPGIVIGLLLAVIYPQMFDSTRLQALKESFVGVLVGGGSLLCLGLIGELLFKKEAMGGGDIKLLAMIGAFLGWQVALLTFFIAPFFGIFAGIAAKLKKGSEFIPYGPHIVFAAFMCLLWGEKILKLILPTM